MQWPRPPKLSSFPLTLRFSEETRRRLADRAAASATDTAGYVSTIVEQNTQNPISPQEISGPISQRFLDSGLTDDELTELPEKEKHEARAQRHARQGP